MDAKQVWRAALGELQVSLSQANFETWLKDTALVDVNESTFTIAVPNGFAKDWLETRYRSLISQTLARVVGYSVQLDFEVREVPPQPEDAVPTQAVRLEPSRVGGEGPSASLNPRYTFSTFIVGSANRLAHAASLSVAERPGHAYNPLFLYGGVGLGKTHLASAVAQFLNQRPRRRVSLLSAEVFANDLIRSLLGGVIDGFRARLRQLDVLIVDDIQFLAGKERMQEEFFHTFNSLHAAGKQIVLASDQAPRSIPHLEERLQNRFESGLIAEIRAPETALRLAIIAQKAKLLGLDLPLEVAQWVAGRIVTSVRELEGALHRLVAACRWSHRSLDLGFAKEVLRPILRTAPPRTLEQVQRVVAERFSIGVEDLVHRARVSRLRVPRQVAMYLARKRTNATYAEIAASFGGRDHSTILHAVKRVEARRREDAEFATLVDGLAEKLGP